MACQAEGRHDVGVARILGSAALSGPPSSSVPPSPPSAAGGPAQPRPALRATRPGWRDPRLWVGVAIVAASVVAGARLLAAADDTVGVWAVAEDLPAGATVTTGDLEVLQVRFADAARLDAYLPATETVPDDVRLRHTLAAGDLLPRSALAPVGETGTVELPIAVEPEQVPESVRPGSVVDVYVVAPADPGAQAARAGQGSVEPDGPVLSGVTVVAAPALADSFGTSGRRQVVLAVPEQDAAAYFAVLGSVQAPMVTVVGRS